MESPDTHTEFAQTLLALLNDEQLPRIDFDRVKEWLRNVTDLLAGHDRLRADADLLRQDYLARIAGMVKAVAAVHRRGADWESALTYLDQLPGMSATELIEQYRLTSARFRDAFPTSFGFIPGRKRGEKTAPPD